MARRRYISTSISVDKAINQLASVGGDFAVMLYTWMIPHAGDDGCLTGDPDEILMTVIPGRRDKTDNDVADALEAMVRCHLIEWDTETVSFPPDSYYRHQSYIKQENRRQSPCSSIESVDERQTPESTDDHREVADSPDVQRESSQNAVSFPSSFPVPVPFSVPDDDGVSEPESGESLELSPHERRVIGILKQTRGMSSVPDDAVALHLREVLGARASPPLPDDVLVAEAMKFRDYNNDKRSSQPVNARWKGWKVAMTNWFSKPIATPQARTSPGDSETVTFRPPYWQPFADED